MTWESGRHLTWNGGAPIPGGESAYIDATTSARWPFNATVALLLGIGLGALVLGFIADDGGVWNLVRWAVFENGKPLGPRIIPLLAYSWEWLLGMAGDLVLIVLAVKFLPKKWPWAKTES